MEVKWLKYHPTALIVPLLWKQNQKIQESCRLCQTVRRRGGVKEGRTPRKNYYNNGDGQGNTHMNTHKWSQIICLYYETNNRYAQEIDGNENLNNSHRIFGKNKENILGQLKEKIFRKGGMTINCHLYSILLFQNHFRIISFTLQESYATKFIYSPTLLRNEFQRLNKECKVWQG